MVRLTSELSSENSTQNIVQVFPFLRHIAPKITGQVCYIFFVGLLHEDERDLIEGQLWQLNHFFQNTLLTTTKN